MGLRSPLISVNSSMSQALTVRVRRAVAPISEVVMTGSVAAHLPPAFPAFPHPSAAREGACEDQGSVRSSQRAEAQETGEHPGIARFGGLGELTAEQLRELPQANTCAQLTPAVLDLGRPRRRPSVLGVYTDLDVRLMFSDLFTSSATATASAQPGTSRAAPLPAPVAAPQTALRPPRPPGTHRRLAASHSA
jgi:hypothetical protein